MNGPQRTWGIPTDGLPVAQVAPPSADGGTQPGVILGVAVNDGNLRQQLWKLLILSLVMGVLATVAAAVAFTFGLDSGTGVVGALGIPVCGYLAIKTKSRSCLRAFALWNMLCASSYIVSALLLVGTTIPLLECVCDTSQALCGGGSVTRANNTSWENLCRRKGSILNGYGLSLGLGGAVAMLQLLGCVWGRTLESNPYFAAVLVEGSPAMMFVAPQGQYGAAPPPQYATAAFAPSYAIYPQGQGWAPSQAAYPQPGQAQYGGQQYRTPATGNAPGGRDSQTDPSCG